MNCIVQKMLAFSSNYGASPIAYEQSISIWEKITIYALHPLVLYNDILLPFMNTPQSFLASWLLTTHPFSLSLHLLTGFITYSIGAFLVNKNVSVVDRSWSIAPVLYTWIYALRSIPHFDFRLMSIAGLTSTWGIRLTYNFWRKGGYQPGHEDYRYPWLRQKSIHHLGNIHNTAWHLFTVLFVCIYQHVLLWALISPICLEAWHFRYMPKHDLVQQGLVHIPWTWIDTSALVLCTLCIGMETVADNQQYRFQTRKWFLLQQHQQSNRPEEEIGPGSITKASTQIGPINHHHPTSSIGQLAKVTTGDTLNTATHLSKIEMPFRLGFCTSGLFRFSRHPNLFAELGFWLCMNLFGIAVVCRSYTLPTKLNLPVPILYGLVMSDWNTLLVLSHHTTKVLTVPVFRYTQFGILNLWMLLNASTFLTEHLSLAKYPKYAEYKAMTSRWVPNFRTTTNDHAVLRSNV